jgi:cell wall-associated NlpC family hydrolase
MPRVWRRVLLAALTAALMAGCASTPAPKPLAPAAPALTGANSADLAFRALGLVGTPYRSAGADPGVGFDCSGFVVYVYRDVLGLPLPRSTAAQYSMDLRSPRRSALKTGDLVFFDTGGKGISHVGIYVGEGRFVHAPNHGGRVRLDHLDDRNWKERYRGARRVLG